MAEPTEARRLDSRRPVLALAAGVLLVDRPGAELAVTLGGVALLAAALDRRALSPRGERIGWSVLVLLALARLTSAIPLAVVGRAGLLVGAAYVLAGALVVFLAADLAGGRASRKARVAAALLALLGATEGLLHLRPDAHADPALADAAPLVARARRESFAPGPDARPDLRDRPFTPRKPAGTFRVALLGGATAACPAQRERASALAGALERALAPVVGPRTPEVLSFASPGDTSEQELGVLLAGATRFEVDLFFALDATEDMQEATRADVFPGDRSDWKRHREALAHPFRRDLALRSALLRPLLAPALAPGPGSDAAPAANGWWIGGLVADEESLAVLAHASGAAFAWAQAPLSPRAAPPLQARARAVRESVGTAVRARGGVVLDLADALDHRRASSPAEEWFSDAGALTDRGVALVAEESARALAAARVVPR